MDSLLPDEAQKTRLCRRYSRRWLRYRRLFGRRGLHLRAQGRPRDGGDRACWRSPPLRPRCPTRIRLPPRDGRPIGARHLVIGSNELEIPGYARKSAKPMLSVQAQPLHRLRSKGAATSASNISSMDLTSTTSTTIARACRRRSEKRVRHPLVEAELTKNEIRELSKMMGLPTWDRPASPCLSSRFPYGTQITLDGCSKCQAARSC